jgi:hypothetical protein
VGDGISGNSGFGSGTLLLTTSATATSVLSLLMSMSIF